MVQSIDSWLTLFQGPPGTGKTTVADRCIARAKARGARILFALPTGQLASRARSKHGDIDVDTCHSAFGFHRPFNEVSAVLCAFDLVVVDEISQLTQEQFERLAEPADPLLGKTPFAYIQDEAATSER